MIHAIYLLHRFSNYRYSLHNFLTQNYYFPKGQYFMRAKNGFLLIELMVGLTISIFFIMIITHYIIEVKTTQQLALKRAEAFSTERNEYEKSLILKCGKP